MIGDSDWAAMARLRQGLYRLFGAALLRPDADRIEALKAGALLLDDEPSIDAFPFAIEWHRLAAAICALSAGGSLESDYIRLFELCSTSPPCPPTETAYGAPPPSSQTALTIKSLTTAYRSAGLELSDQVWQTCDHAATELEFMAYLCGLEFAACTNVGGDDPVALSRRQLAFVNDHLIGWFGLFTHRVRSSGVGFYDTLVHTAWTFIQHDHNLLTVLTAEITRMASA